MSRLLTIGATSFDLDARPIIMGILNVTPDSFSDGGQFATLEAARRHADQMVREGADCIDVGGESTRPGAATVEIDEEIRRTVPVIKAIARAHPSIPVSIDTRHAPVAAAALDVGATMVNDITAATGDEAMLPLCAARAVPICLMHMQGTPAQMQQSPHYDDVVQEVYAYLAERITAARAAGVTRVIIDVGFGFGKNVEHNLELLHALETFRTLGAPILLGVSRKSFIGKLIHNAPVGKRLFGTAAAVTVGVLRGADILRVHDVRAMREVATMAFALRT
jgi:dihydropteroate synthase